MMQPNEMKEVRFDLYCPDCEWRTTYDDEEPCDTCLHHPTNLHSQKPLKFRKKEENKA